MPTRSGSLTLALRFDNLHDNRDRLAVEDRRSRPPGMAASCCHVVKYVVKVGRVARLVGACHRDQVSLDMREEGPFPASEAEHFSPGPPGFLTVVLPGPE